MPVDVGPLDVRLKQVEVSLQFRGSACKWSPPTLGEEPWCSGRYIATCELQGGATNFLLAGQKNSWRLHRLAVVQDSSWHGILLHRILGQPAALAAELLMSCSLSSHTKIGMRSRGCPRARTKLLLKIRVFYMGKRTQRTRVQGFPYFSMT